MTIKIHDTVEKVSIEQSRLTQLCTLKGINHNNTFEVIAENLHFDKAVEIFMTINLQITRDRNNNKNQQKEFNFE